MCEFEAHIVQPPKTPGHDAKCKPLGTAQFAREPEITTSRTSLASWIMQPSTLLRRLSSALLQHSRQQYTEVLV